MNGNSRHLEQARLASMRQELLAPVNAILGYAEMLREAAPREHVDGSVQDFEEILIAARELFDLVQHLLAPEHAASLLNADDTGTSRRKLRHDLRVPLHAIKGYIEIVLEDMQETGNKGLHDDVMQLTAEVHRLLAQLDTIIEFHAASRLSADVFNSMGEFDEGESLTVAGATILVVDDNASNRQLLSRRLAREGHRVRLAENGRQALEMAAGDGVDLVLLDLMMPEMNGFEVLTHLKRDDRLRDIPVIVISAIDELSSVIHCFDAGAEDYLPRPFEHQLLKARINARLRRKRWREDSNLPLDGAGPKASAIPPEDPSPVGAWSPRDLEFKQELQAVLVSAERIGAGNRHLSTRNIADILDQSGRHWVAGFRSNR